MADRSDKPPPGFKLVDWRFTIRGGIMVPLAWSDEAAMDMAKKRIRDGVSIQSSIMLPDVKMITHAEVTERGSQLLTKPTQGDIREVSNGNQG